MRNFSNIYSSPDVNRVIKSVRIKRQETLGLHGRIKRIFKKEDGKVWIEFIWLGIRKNDELL
jgi:hypothetical protein